MKKGRPFGLESYRKNLDPHLKTLLGNHTASIRLSRGFRTKTFDFRTPKNLDPIFLLLQKSNLVRISNPPKSIFPTQIWIFPPKISISPPENLSHPGFLGGGVIGVKCY